ncbi:uncharacterized protein LOC114359256 [Ostrinia furnacalis]|uniref:uncharacterized protein LOC114359256 n=1 Tax=Ostrinia furnacalis TaxID=93504 RepID=UPI001040B46B|nr:uncharacterized protein LOC114359256 [Ostrinia furnacalis]
MASRGSRLIKALELYTKFKPNQFDTSVILKQVKINSITAGVSRSTFTVERSMCNGGDTLHGGFIAACVDALSTFAHLGTTGKIAWTMGLNLDFIAAARIGEVITVETSVLRPGSLTAVETSFRNSQGALVAKGTTTLMNGRDQYQKLVKEIYHFDPNEVDDE